MFYLNIVYFLKGGIPKCFMFSTAKIILISILTKIILILISFHNGAAVVTVTPDNHRADGPAAKPSKIRFLRRIG